LKTHSAKETPSNREIGQPANSCRQPEKEVMSAYDIKRRRDVGNNISKLANHSGQ
jgi:hypothetical protein